jgi:hypothetical protein
MRKTRGVVSKRLVLQIEPIAALEDGTLIYPIMGSEDDPEEQGDGDDDEGDSDNDDGDEDESEKDKDEKPKRRPKSKETPEQKVRRLNAENKARREELEAAQARLREIEDKDKSELEIVKRDFEEYKSKHESSEQRIQDLLVENAFLKLDRDKYNWHDPDDVIDKIRKDVTITDDGEVDGLEDAVKALAKSKPYLLKKKAEDGEEGDDKGKRRPPRGPSGATLGGPKSPKGDQKAQREADLKKKYKLW